LISQEKKSKSRHDTGPKRDVQRIPVDQAGELWNVFLGDGLEFQAEGIRLGLGDDAVNTDLTLWHEEMDMN